MEGRSEDVADAVRHGRPRNRDEWGIEFGRIVAFSDSVFAIAITLLVLQFDIPAPLPEGRTLLDELQDLEGDTIAYAISFAVLGKLWLNHHRFFSAVSRFDGGLMALNLVYLAFIVLVPFTSEVLGDYGNEPAGVVLYAVVLAAIGIVFAAQIVYAYRSGLIRPELREVERRYAAPTSVVIAGVFLLSIPVALFAPLAAVLMWAIIFLTGRRVVDIMQDMRS